MLKATALRARMETATVFPTDTTPPPTKNTLNPQADTSPPPPDQPPQTHDDFIIPLGDCLIPSHPDQPIPPNIGHIRLTLNETLRLIWITKSGLRKARMAFHLRWSRWRRRHQAIARWHHFRARLTTQAAPA